MNEETKNKILTLYFEQMYSIEELLMFFDYKYTENEIWGVLDTKWGD